MVTVRLGQAWLRTGAPPALSGAKVRLGYAALNVPPAPKKVRLGYAALRIDPAQVRVRLGYSAVRASATAYPVYVMRGGSFRPVRLYGRVGGAWVLLAPVTP